MGSTRLPGKVLADIGGRPALSWTVAAARAIPGVDRVVVATSHDGSDDPIAAWCAKEDTPCFRGSQDDVLDRFVQAAAAEKATLVFRLTADCPLLDPHVCGQVLALLRRTGADYATNNDPAVWPDGLDCEVVTVEALKTAAAEARLPSEREHVTSFIRKHRHRFKVVSLGCPLPGLNRERWTLDTPEDLGFLRAVAERLNHSSPPSFMEILALLDDCPSLRSNANEGPRGAAFVGTGVDRRVEEMVGAPRSYQGTNRLLERAERTIPLGSQTFSKSRIQFPEGASPLFLSHGQGGRVWDVDGNEYVDLMSGLHPVVLGYRDAEVDGAIRDQLSRGISFSLATALEADLAERLVEIIPCAEKVRFGKNGTDATSAAIRLARAFTGRDRVAAGGYHGWQDWYIGATTRNKGVPAAVGGLTHRFPFNDLPALEKLLGSHPGEFAAVILEPMTKVDPLPGYLEEVKRLTHRHGALLVFDEIITGFRFSLGGAQELFGVCPDLAAFGKAMGNGMPISAVVGRSDVMDEMEEIFFSATFGGETLSLAAAIAVIDKMRCEPVIAGMWQTGQTLRDEISERIDAHGLGSVILLRGQAPWVHVEIRSHPTARAEAIQTLFKREMSAHGVLIGGGHNVNYAHQPADLAVVTAAYDRTLATIAAEMATGELESRLDCPVLKPVFAVRGGA